MRNEERTAHLPFNRPSRTTTVCRRQCPPPPPSVCPLFHFRVFNVFGNTTPPPQTGTSAAIIRSRPVTVTPSDPPPSSCTPFSLSLPGREFVKARHKCSHVVNTARSVRSSTPSIFASGISVAARVRYPNRILSSPSRPVAKYVTRRCGPLS